MCSEQISITATEQLAKGWELTKKSMALLGFEIPSFLHFRIDSARQIRATVVAELDDLAKGIDEIDEDIQRLLQGAAALSYTHTNDIEQLRHEKAALTELQRRTSLGGLSGSTSVIEALFPAILVKKKTASEKAEIEQWLAIRKEAGLKIDPETADVEWGYGRTLDPYGVLDEWELPEEFSQVGREYFARAPGSDIWVSFHDLPEETSKKLWERNSHKLAFPAGLEEIPDEAIVDDEVLF